MIYFTFEETFLNLSTVHVNLSICFEIETVKLMYCTVDNYSCGNVVG